MSELIKEFGILISNKYLQDFLYEREIELLKSVLARLIKIEKDLNDCADILSESNF